MAIDPRPHVAETIVHKRPSEEAIIGFEFSAAQVGPSDSISSLETPASDPSGITFISQSFERRKAAFSISGGKPAFRFTAATTGTLTAASHGLSSGDRVVLSHPENGALPSGLEIDRPYWARDVAANTFALALYSGGPAIPVYATGHGICGVEYEILCQANTTQGQQPNLIGRVRMSP